MFLIFPSFWDFVLLFLNFRGYLCIIHVYEGCVPLYTLNEFALLAQKKKKKNTNMVMTMMTMTIEIHCPHYMIDYKTYVKTNHSTSFTVIILTLHCFNFECVNAKHYPTS